MISAEAKEALIQEMGKALKEASNFHEQASALGLMVLNRMEMKHKVEFLPLLDIFDKVLNVVEDILLEPTDAELITIAGVMENAAVYTVTVEDPTPSAQSGTQPGAHSGTDVVTPTNAAEYFRKYMLDDLIMALAPNISLPDAMEYAKQITVYGLEGSRAVKINMPQVMSLPLKASIMSIQIKLKEGIKNTPGLYAPGEKPNEAMFSNMDEYGMTFFSVGDVHVPIR